MTSIAGPRPFLGTDTDRQEPLPAAVSQMPEVRTGSSMPPAAHTDLAANVRAGVTVYFLGGEQNLLYVQINGQWVEYIKSTPLQEPGRRTHPEPGPDAWPDPVHWAGYTCHSPYEITPDRKRRTYHDPAARPDLFPALDGQPPTLPLPVLELTTDPQDPAPWLDPDTGERLTPEQASLALRLLRYSPRKPQTPADWQHPARSHRGSPGTKA
jgi:hypothetical protein